jgi:hypothetical protein
VRSTRVDEIYESFTGSAAKPLCAVVWLQSKFRSVGIAMDEGAPLPQELLVLATLISESIETFASGSNEVQLAALNATKCIFDLGIVS